LLLSVLGDVHRVQGAVLAGVVWVAVPPGPLGVLLVFSVERVILELPALPGLAAFTLACRFGTERLVRDLGAGEKGLAAAGADLGFHLGSPYKSRYGNRLGTDLCIHLAKLWRTQRSLLKREHCGSLLLVAASVTWL